MADPYDVTEISAIQAEATLFRLPTDDLVAYLASDSAHREEGLKFSTPYKNGATKIDGSGWGNWYLTENQSYSNLVNGETVISIIDDWYLVAIGLADITYQIPSEIPTLDEALDYVVKKHQSNVSVNLNIESGHTPTVGYYIENGYYGNITITSTDATVTASSEWVGNVGVTVPDSDAPDGTAFIGVNSVMPTHDFLFDMDDHDGGGIVVAKGSIYITTGSGVNNAGFIGLRGGNASRISARGSIFSGCGEHGVKCSRGCLVDISVGQFTGNCKDPKPITLALSSVDFSKGCFFSARDMICTGSFANGLEVRRSFGDCEGADISGNVGDPTQFAKGNIVLQYGSIVSALSCNCSDGDSNGAFVNSGSILNASGSTFNDNSSIGIYSQTNANVSLPFGECYGNGSDDLYVERGGTINADRVLTSNSEGQTYGTLITSTEDGDNSLRYIIYNYVAGDDFDNVGADGVGYTGEVFKSTGTTPSNWTNGSELRIFKPSIDDTNLDDFNYRFYMGEIKSSKHKNPMSWTEGTLTLQDQSGNDGNTYGTQQLNYRITDGTLEVFGQVSVTAVGSSINSGERIIIKDPFDVSLSETSFFNCGTINSGVTIGSAVNLTGIMLTNGDIQFNTTGNGVNTALNWSNVTATFGFTFNFTVKLS